MIKNRFTLFSYLLLFFYPLILLAQRDLKSNTINFNSGLPSDYVCNTVKKDNYLYVATHRGLSMYDGYRFINHTTLTSKISNLKVKNNKIYFYDAILGLCSLDKFDQKATIIAPNKYTDSTAHNDHYENIFIDSKNRVWCTDARYIKYFESNKKQYFEFDKKNADILKPIAILEPNDSQIWFATYKGLYIWNSKTNKITSHHNNTLAELSISSACFSENKNILYVTSNKEFFAYNIKDNKITKKSNIPKSIIITQIQTSFQNGKTHLILNSNKYVYQMDEDKSELNLLFDSKKSKINHVNIDDKTHNLWVSTNRGLIQLKNDSNIVNIVLPTKNPKTVVSIVQDKNQNIFMALDSDEIWSYSKDHIWKKYHIPNAICKNLTVNKNQILIATTNGLFSIENNHVTEIKLPNFTKEIKKCIIDFNNNLWVLPITKTVGVFDFETLKRKEKFVQNQISFWQGNQWNDILCDNFGTVWLAGWMPKSQGILKFDIQKNIFLDVSKFNVNKKGKNFFVADYINRIAITKDNNLLFSSYGGWNELDKNGIVTKSFASDINNLSSYHLEGICEDSSGNIWFATAEGLYVFTKKLKKTIRFSQINGLFTDELINGFCKLNDEKIALGYENGISIVNTKEILRQNINSDLKLTSVSIDGRILKYIPNNIFLKNTEAQLTLSFSDLTFSNKLKVNYRYKFKGEKKWNHLNNNSELSFVKLPSKNYNLILQNGDNSNNWNPKSLEIKINIQPEFYETWWFLLLVLLLVFTIILTVNWYLLKQQRIKSELTQKIKDAEMQTLRSQMNPHFMFNTLNSINSFIIQNKSKDASKYLTMFSKLMRNILENSKYSEITLEKEIQTLKLYIELESVRLENKFNYFINTKDGVDIETIKIPPLVVQPFVENAIWHALNNKKEQGNLYININCKRGNILKIEIIDDGIGRHATSMMKKQQTNHKSYGIEITVSRIKMLNERNSVEIIDLYNTDKTASGTQVNLKIHL